MAQFTQEERKQLYALFPVHQHAIRQGETSKDGRKIRWYLYVEKEAIIDRLDDLFFGEWQNGYVFRERYENAFHTGMHLTIRGIRREFDGVNDGSPDNQATLKGSSTDAFKRVCALWGIGSYLANAPKIWTDNYKDANGKPDWKKKDQVESEALYQFAQWLKSIGSTGNTLSAVTEDPVEDAPAPVSEPLPSTNGRKPSAPFPGSDLIDQIVAYCNENGLNEADARKALGVRSWASSFPNFDVARKVIDEKLLDQPEDTQKEIPF